jgi:hypothetical protein
VDPRLDPEAAAPARRLSALVVDARSRPNLPEARGRVVLDFGCTAL